MGQILHKKLCKLLPHTFPAFLSYRCFLIVKSTTFFPPFLTE